MLPYIQYIHTYIRTYIQYTHKLYLHVCVLSTLVDRGGREVRYVIDYYHDESQTAADQVGTYIHTYMHTVYMHTYMLKIYTDVYITYAYK